MGSRNYWLCVVGDLSLLMLWVKVTCDHCGLGSMLEILHYDSLRELHRLTTECRDRN